uniref:Exocyst complex component 7 n=1 Tax=Aceria tosichella TaxID=561515 RepID=A0A6G1SHS1_9ACAR
MMSNIVVMDENRKKLELETKSLALLKEMSQKCCAHTSSIKTILSEFDDRLSRLEQNIQPVYKKTGNLQLKQEDLVGALEKLDYVIQYYSVTNEVDETIRAGPANQLDAYMRCLSKLKSAIQYFATNNPGSPEYMNVTSLYKYGCEAIEKDFKTTLQRYSSPIAPIALIDMISDDAAEQQLDSTNSGNTTTTSTSGSFRRQQPDMPQEKIEDLKIMFEWLSANCNDDLASVYADLRSDFISKSLKSLQDYQKSRSIPFNIMAVSHSGSPGGPGTGSSSRSSIDSPDLAINKKRMGMSVSSTSSRDQSYRRTPKSIQMAFKRKLHNVIPGDTKLSTGSIDEISITEREIISYLTCITAFHKLAVNELNLMSNIIVADLRTPIYNRLIQESLRLISNEANNLTIRVKKSIARHDFKSALNLFPILRHQTLRRHNFDLLFDGCQSEALARFQGLTITFQATISKSLEEFASYVHTDSDMKVPRDGTVHELTNNVMIFIEQLREYLDIMSNVIPVKDMQAMENTTDRNRLGFAQYITRLLGSLGETIQRKAEYYTNLHLVFLFKLNNFHYILKRLIESDLLDIVHSYNQNVKDIYERLIVESRKEYIKSLHPVINHLKDLQESKKAIKDKFTSFNKEFQELHRANRTYAVPDVELRIQLRNACKNEFLQYYQQFYNYHMSQDFSKNKEKYAKYTPESLAQMIDQFFEAN